MTSWPESSADVIQRTAAHVQSVLAADAAHDWHHIRRVWQMAVRIGREEAADLPVVELAALLHDIADWKFHGGDETAGPRAADAWLRQCEVPAGVREHVVRIIGDLSFKGAGVPTPMHSIEGAVVQDADRLDAIGAVGVARAFAYGGYKGQPLFDPEAQTELHASFAAYQKGAGSTIHHFYEKLLLLRDRMNTAAARRLAEERHRVLEQFLEQFLAEWNGER